MTLIAPALLAADFARLQEALRTIEAAGCRMVHLDVGDGHFCPDVSMGHPVVESIRKATKLELDVHLLVERPERYVPDFARAGADRLAVHPESTPHLYRTLDLIRNSGAKAGIALQRGSSLTLVSELLDQIDFLNVVMADHDAELDLDRRREQSGIRDAGIEKLREAFRTRERQGLRFELEVEGSIHPGHAADLAAAGADILVSGFAIFQEGQLAARLNELMTAADRAISSGAEKSKGVLIPSNS